MSGGAVRGNTVSSYGGGVGVFSNGTFSMNGGEVSGNTAYHGGGVYVDGGAFTMNGGEVSRNTASVGGGVGVRYGGTFRMSGGEVKGNTATFTGGGGGGVCIFYGNSATITTFTKTGGIIYGNDNIPANNNTATGRGHTVYIDDTSKQRNATAGSGVNLYAKYDGHDDAWTYDDPDTAGDESLNWE
jgi:hypothetical protein